MSEAQPEPRIAVIIRSVAWVGIVAHAAFVPLFWLTGYPLLAYFNVLSVPTWLLAWHVNRRGQSTLAMWLLAAEVIFHAVLAGLLLGWDTGFQYYLIPLIPFLMFNDRAPLRVVHAASAGVLVVFIVLRAIAPTDAVLPSELAWCRYANLIIPFGTLALLSHFFRLASTDVERRMTEMALTDPLTGLYNRREMTQRLEDAAARFQKRGTNFSVIVADIDHFKAINDRHGHDVGDRVLSHVAQLFSEGLRTGDAVARWGGEEFLMLLPGTDLDAAQEVAERLRSTAEKQLGVVEALRQPLTITCGVATYVDSGSLEACLKAADEALYRGKAEGRNRVVAANRQ